MKAQVSFEYILVAAIVAMIAIPATYTFYKYSQGSQSEIRESQAVKFGRDTVNTAELIYYQGPPSRITLEQTLPEGVRNISILQDWDADPRVNELVITADLGTGQNDFAF